MYSTNWFPAIIAVTVLLFGSIPGAFPQSGTTFTTHQAWEFVSLDDILSSSTVGDVSGDGIADVIIAADDKSIYVLDGVTGKKIWTYAGVGISTWTAIIESPDNSDDGKPEVVVASNNRILMLDGAIGEQKWNFSLSTDTPSSDPCFPSLRSLHMISDVDGDGLEDVAIVAGSSDQCAKEDEILVLALSGIEGTKIWEYSYKVDFHGLKEGTRGSTPAAVLDFDKDGSKDIVVIDDKNVMHIVDGQTGNALETIELKVFGAIWELMLIPDISDDGVEDAIAFEFIEGGGGPDYASTDAINLLSAEVIWHIKAGDGLYNGGALYSGTWLSGQEVAYVAVTQRIENDLHLAVVNARTGEEVWRFGLGQEKSRSDLEKYYPVVRVPNLMDSSLDELAVGSFDSRSYLLDGSGGHIIWSHPIDKEISDIMYTQLQGDQVYVIVEDKGRVHALAGLSEIETNLSISVSAETITLTELPDRITITGTLKPAFRGEIVELRFVDPAGHVTTVPLIVAADGSFIHVIEPQIVGTWKVMAEFDGEGYYLDSKSYTINFIVKEQEPGSSIYRLEVGGSDVSYPIAYNIEGGNVTGMSVDKENKSLGIAISAMQHGTLTINLPRNVIDAFDSSYQVYVDGEAADFQEIGVGAGFRTLVIPFSESAEQVQVSGTYVVPEFTVVSIIMALGTVGVIVTAAMHKRFLNI